MSHKLPIVGKHRVRIQPPAQFSKAHPAHAHVRQGQAPPQGSSQEWGAEQSEQQEKDGGPTLWIDPEDHTSTRHNFSCDLQ